MYKKKIRDCTKLQKNNTIVLLYNFHNTKIILPDIVQIFAARCLSLVRKTLFFGGFQYIYGCLKIK